MSLTKIIKVQIEFSFFDEAETLIRSRSNDQPVGQLLELADALTAAVETTKADVLRQEYDEYWLRIDDRSALMPLLSLAESYTTANERDKARRVLKNGMDLAKYEDYDFGLLMQIICDHYIDCGFLEEFKSDVSQYADREGVKYELERIDQALRKCGG